MSQTTTLFNTKSTAVYDVKIIEQVPVSQDSAITVKLVAPALSSDQVGEKKASLLMVVSHDVVARWHGAEDTGVDVASLGKDGKLIWTCSVPPQGKVNLVLQWEISAPADVEVMELNEPTVIMRD
jgi:hypothetical protein